MVKRCQTLALFACLYVVAVSSPTATAGAQFEPKSQPAQLSRQQQVLRHKIQTIAYEIQLSHKLTVVYESFDSLKVKHSQLSYGEAEPKDYVRVYEYLLLLQQELAKYPGNFFKPSQLKAIYIVKRLFNEDKNAQGIYDYRNKVILFDFAKQHGGELALKHNIHHEIFHVIDTNSFYWQGKGDWSDYNVPGFEYVKKGKVYVDAHKNEANYFAPNKKGFVTYYAMMSPYEDRAEVFACLFVKPQHKLIHRWAKKDRRLNKKIQYIKEFLSVYSDGAIDEGYFDRLWSQSR